MLRLKNIKKDYKVADTFVAALKGINLSFRKNEFVSILGPSGCGKTTMLNIIGGLDKYTSGDLFINGKSTKEFKDKDWDSYRNHRIGFIFQSYNLIPHQTILGNVELALSIAGMSKAERIEKAKKALDKVGLKGQYNKKPNQLSGGQCQRVAVARALVNDPDILLADEPTGALDTVTSVQIMDLIKEIAEEKLVIMVTHNPELADKYSTRIIRLLDGEVIDDTNPFDEDAEIKECEDNKKEEPVDKNGKKQKKEKSRMSFFTSFKLSLKNLFSKKVRTILTSIAGAIGIIGVSVVLSISNGVQMYIKNMQDDMLSGNPIVISQTAMDINAMMANMTMEEKKEIIKKDGEINVNAFMEYMAKRTNNGDMIINNNITQDYVDYIQSIPKEHVAATFLNYGIDVSNNIYTSFSEGKDSEKQDLSLSAIKTRYSEILKLTEYSMYSSLISTLSDSFKQAPNDEDYILQQYNKLHGKVATNENEIMIVVNKDRQLTDLLLAQLGYYTQDEFMNLVYKTTDDDRFESSIYKDTFSYEELIGKEFTYYPNDTVFKKNEIQPGLPPQLEELAKSRPFDYNYTSDMKGFDKTSGIKLKVVGILEPKETISYGCLTSGFYYTEALTKEIIDLNKDSEIVQCLNEKIENGEDATIPSGKYAGVDIGITYEFGFEYPKGEKHENVVGYVGKTDMMSSFLSIIPGMGGNEMYTLNLQQVGGSDLPSEISIYPVNFEEKDVVNEYLDKWNSDEDITFNGKTLTSEQREKITYTDMLSIVIAMINDMINVITYALIGFTSLSLLVSCVMIGIITHVSVVDRTKEIGVIRSLGGRKNDVSNLFNAETFMIGLASGIIGIGVTYAISILISFIVKILTGVGPIAIFPWYYALIMIGVSVLLTLISGFIPARSAAKKDPVNALRSE